MDDEVGQRGFGTSSECLRELIRRDQDRMRLWGLLLAGVASEPTEPAGAAYFDALRARARPSTMWLRKV